MADMDQRSRFPKTCPNSGCSDPFPHGALNMQAEFDHIFSKRDKLLSDPRHDPRKLEKINQDICSHIKHENDIRRLDKLRSMRGWPVSFDFDDIVNRTLSLKQQLADLILSDYDLHNCVVWDDFLESIDYKIHKFGALKEPYDHEYAVLRARCGYLGPEGAFLIHSTILRIFHHTLLSLPKFLTNTIQLLIDERPQDFDSPHPDSTRRPWYILPIDTFIRFVLVPHVAVYLISQDMGVSYTEAIDIKDDSAEYGEMFHWNDKSPRITSIDKANFVAAQDDFPFPDLSSLRNKVASPTNPLPAKTLSPKRSKKTVNKLPASPMEEVVVTLEDFPPRNSKTKTKTKTGEEPASRISKMTKPEKEKKEKSAPKENPIRIQLFDFVFSSLRTKLFRALHM
ncbi:hypothetical protein MVEN_00123400 [Mycena venus]|uniref:Restriction of telomere capping protein 4 n=1 Tax=Mycena venus TaxID=2733690 RepID=A0A8H6ZBE7_9AGAR|nr:hypothetical protein MVEN_00123400 [Mycena venus]